MKAAQWPSSRTRRRCICRSSPCLHANACAGWSRPTSGLARDRTRDPRRCLRGDEPLARAKAPRRGGPARTQPCCRRRIPGREARCPAGTSVRIAKHESCGQSSGSPQGSLASGAPGVPSAPSSATASTAMSVVLSGGGEGADDRTRQVRTGVLALVDEVLEHPLHLRALDEADAVDEARRVSSLER